MLLLTVLIWIISNGDAFSQEPDKIVTALYLEIGGKGFFGFNVDFPLAPKSRLTLGLTALDPEFAKRPTETEYPTMALPTPSVMFLQLFGKQRHYFETGVGVSISPVPWKEYSPNDSMLSLHAALGYRYQVSSKFFFRAGVYPFYRINWMFLPLPGVSLGYSW